MGSNGNIGQYRTLLIDLDDTLYRNPRVPLLMRENIQEYMKSKLRVPAEEVPALCTECYATYGTTMAGLEAKGYKFDYDDWHAHVHGQLPYTELLQRDPQLAQALKAIPLPKWVFTNGDIRHAETCLRILGLDRGIFEGIICFESVMKQAQEEGALTAETPICCKPNAKAFEIALRQCGGRADTSIFVDDSSRNVAGARKLGIFTVQAGCESPSSPAHLTVNTLHELPSVLGVQGMPKAPAVAEQEQPLAGIAACPA